jgi:hypothetical protein
MAGLILAIAVGHAIWRTLLTMGSDPNPDHYIYMAPEARMAENTSLTVIVSNVGETVTPKQYFETLTRFKRLSEAMQRARIEENRITKMAYKGAVMTEPVASDIVHLGLLENMYVNEAQSKMLRETTQAQLEKARKNSGIEDIAITHTLPPDPFLQKSWILIYFAGLLFAFGHFHIHNQKLGGGILLASDIRFWMWLIVWIPGVFRYPTAIDIKYQFRRAQRFATFILSTCLPLTAGACAGKRIKTEPDGKKSTEIAWVIKAEVSTTTWPKYLGGNGAVFHPEPVQQTAINVPLPKGFYTGAWHSIPLGGRELVPNFGHEIDFSGGWNGKISGFNLNADMTYIGVTPLAQYGGDVLQLSTTASRDVKVGSVKLSPYFWVAYAIPTAGNSPGRGDFYHEGVRWGQSKGLWSVGANAELMHDSGAFGFNTGHFARGGVTVGRPVTKHLRVDIPIQWSVPLSKLNDGRRREAMAGATLSIH